MKWAARSGTDVRQACDHFKMSPIAAIRPITVASGVQFLTDLGVASISDESSSDAVHDNLLRL